MYGYTISEHNLYRAYSDILLVAFKTFNVLDNIIEEKKKEKEK